ncbi:MAG: hypothetical protein Q8N46_02225 [Anaerolineales bacterium]|nr:hypothetical protein [Anaerolineales bacterium]
MSIVEFQPQPGESILYRTTPNRKWYVIAWKIGSSVVGITILTFIIFTLLKGPTEAAFISFLPAWAASLLIKSLYLGLFPLAAAAWVAEDVACTFIGEFILTDQRIWVRGSPYAWSQSVTPLEDIVSLTWRRDAIFIKQKSNRKIQVHMISDGKLFVKAYEQFAGKSKTP